MLGLPDEPGRSTEDTRLEFLAARQALLVLDNCEHLLGRLASFSARSWGLPALTVLATSREPIGVAGEAIWRVARCRWPAKRWSCSSTAPVRSGRISASAPTRMPSRSPRSVSVLTVCRCDRTRRGAGAGVVAGRNRRQPARSFPPVDGRARTAVRRQQTLRASVDWSYGLLTELERVLLRRLAVFMGGLDLQAAQTVAGGEEVASHQVLDLLTLLVDKSLVVAETTRGRTRYRLLETVRQYAQEKLGESGEADVLRARHREHYMAVAARLMPLGKPD